MTTTFQSEQPLISAKKIAVTNGFIMAAISVILFLLAYYAVPELMGNWAYSIVQMLIGLGIAVYFTLDIRKKIGGYWSFREALSAIFVMFIIQVVVVYFFTVAFGKWIEPSYADRMKEIVLNSTTEMIESFSDDQELIDKTIEETEVALDKQFNPGPMDMVRNLAVSVIMYFIGALIFAAIFKRERPVFINPEEWKPEGGDELREQP